MPSATVIQTNFTAGALSPLLYGRVDIAKYQNGCATLENFITQRFGGIRKRGGTEYINEVKTSAKKVRLIPFIFSVTQAYILEFGDLYIRIYTNGGVVESGGSPVEVVTPWDEDEIFELQFAQSADILYIAHPDHAPRQFERTSATSFTLSTVDFEDGPYLPINTTTTRLTPAATGDLLDKSGSASSSPALGGGTMADLGDDSVSSGAYVSARTWTITYDFNSTDAYICDGYYLSCSDKTNLAPARWDFQGYTGSAWVTLDSRSGVTWTPKETKTYSFINTSTYQQYRVVMHANQAGDNAIELSEWGLHQAAAEQTAFNLTASAVTGINGGDGFATTDVGRHIRLLGADGIWRWAKIVARTSSTVVTIRVYGQALPGTGAIVNWRLGAWSDETGWPAAVGFYEGRLCWARTAEQPETVWMSKVDDFTDHGVSDPVQDDDAVEVTIRSESLNEIKWIAESADMFVGTRNAIRVIGPNSPTGTFSPTNLRQRRETTFGAGDVQPILVGNVGIYADYYRSALREFAYSFELNGYVSQDMTLLSEHLFRAGVKEIAYAQNPDALIWCVMDDGSLTAITFERDQEVVAAHKHVIGGTGVTVESIAVIPGSAGDEVWMVVKRTINAGTKRYIERLSAGLADDGTLSGATFLDSHLTYSGVSTTSLTGLSHLEGESVYVWGDAGKQGPYTVSSGAITVGTAVTVACVGLAYTSTYESLSPEAAAQGGTAQTRLGHTSEVFVRLNRSMNGTIGPADGTQETLPYADSIDNDGSFGSASTLYTGDVRVPIAMKWERNKRLKLVHSDPTPFHCIGMIYEHRVSG